MIEKVFFRHPHSSLFILFVYALAIESNVYGEIQINNQRKLNNRNLSIIISSTQNERKIKKIYKLKNLLSYLKTISLSERKKTLIVVDLDGVLIKGCRYTVPEIMEKYKPIFNELKKEPMFKETGSYFGVTKSFELIEKEAPKIFSKITDLKFPMVVCSGIKPVLSLLDNLLCPKIQFHKLLKLGFNCREFSQFLEHPKSKEKIFIKDGIKLQVFYKGLIAVGSDDKGPAVHKIVKWNKIKRLLFLDDKRDYLTNFKNYFEERGVPVDCFWYRAEDLLYNNKAVTAQEFESFFKQTLKKAKKIQASPQFKKKIIEALSPYNPAN